MRRQQFIKPAHIWMVTVLIACGLWVVAGKAGITIQGQQNSNQNQNQNQNTNGNQNANTGQNRNANTNANTGENRNANTNANTGENRNANTTGNRNTGTGNTGARGEQAGMANMSSRDRDFVMDAAMSSMLEVELGRIAAQQGASDSVKQFGQMMVDHHQKANTELMTLASSKGVTLPTALDEKHQQQLTKLQGLSGAEFDRAYARLMVREHRDAVSDFEKENSRGTDTDLKAFAGKTLPILQEHLRMARALEDEHGGGNNRNNNSNTGGNRNSNTGGNRNNNGNNNNNSNRP
jgi:putative membrane protein